MANSRSGESVLQRTVRILKAFDVDHPRLSAAEICRRTGLPQSTAHRLANEMCDVGLLQRLQEGDFIVSPTAWEMFVRSNPLERLRFRAQPVMESVHNTLRHYVSLTTPDFEQRSILYIERFNSRSDASILGRHASRLDLHTTSSGLVMLAFARDSIVDQVLSVPLKDSITGVITDPGEIRAMLPGIRKKGYTHIVGGLVAENTSMAVPIFDARGIVIAALGVVAKTAECDHESVISTLRVAGRNLSLSLGDVPDIPTF